MSKVLGALPVVFLLLLLAGAVFGKVLAGCYKPSAAVSASATIAWVPAASGAFKGDRLIVIVPGLGNEERGQQERWAGLVQELSRLGDVAAISYPTGLLANAPPQQVAQKINEEIQRAWMKKPYRRIVIVGFSMGALLARQSILYASGVGSPSEVSVKPWSGHIERLVLLAGMNRGWDLSGEKPSDMRWHTYAVYSVAAWFAALTHTGQLLLNMEAGSPFVADLRMDWMRWARAGKAPETVQLLGDIDEMVSSEDNADLRVSTHSKFAWLKVRGTGHASILDIDESGHGLGKYRKDKIVAAVDAPFDALRALSEELPYPTDDAVKQVVFVMHGIRDLGEWSSVFETDLRDRAMQVNSGDKLAIASIRYGYFGMGQFLLRRDRQKYVRWFMDQYTETLARYPEAEKIDFVGHSNGTYLLGSALHSYPSMQVRRVVMGGSVLPKKFDWESVFERGQVQQVRNYVADDDWVVALFPRFFESGPGALLGNDIGSAGFNGFDAGPAPRPVENVKFIQGQHGAFLKQSRQIAAFLIPHPGGVLANDATPATPAPTKSAWIAPFLNFFSKWFTWALWAALAFVIVWLGSRVSGAAGHLSAVALVLYLIVVFQVLRWV